MSGANSRAPGTGGLGAGGVMNSDMGALALTAKADMDSAKACLAVLFMHARCTLPADVVGHEALQALAAPLASGKTYFTTEDNFTIVKRDL